MSQYSLKEPIIGAKGYDYNLVKVPLEGKNSIGTTLTGEIIDLNPSNIHFNATLLFEMSIRITAVAMRVYMALLKRMVSNDIPITCYSSVFRTDIKDPQKSKKVNWALQELEREKMILRNKDNLTTYYINPLFAWTGDRTRYFDPSTLPLVDPEEE